MAAIFDAARWTAATIHCSQESRRDQVPRVHFLLASSFSIHPLPHPRPPFPSLPSPFISSAARLAFLPTIPFPLFFHYLISRDAARRERETEREKERERERERFEEKRKVPGRKKGFNYSGRRNVLTRCTGNRLSSIYLSAINI